MINYILFTDLINILNSTVSTTLFLRMSSISPVSLSLFYFGLKHTSPVDYIGGKSLYLNQGLEP